ncbi:hypothetical protein OSTOST_02630 [Ostertagia ostertagi]
MNAQFWSYHHVKGEAPDLVFGVAVMEEEEAVPSAVADGNECTEDPVVLLTIVSTDEKPTTSKEVPESPPADEENPRRRRQCNLKLSGQLFYGVVEASKRGIHPVIRYPIPDTDTCYAFEHVQNGCEFIGDPAELPHVCTPLKNAEDKVTRMVYQSCQAIATDPTLGEKKPNQLWKSIAQFIDDNAPDDEAERKMMLKHFYKSGYKCRRRSIARAAAKAPRPQDTEEKGPQKRPVPKAWSLRMKRCSF